MLRRLSVKPAIGRRLPDNLLTRLTERFRGSWEEVLNQDNSNYFVELRFYADETVESEKIVVLS